MSAIGRKEELYGYQTLFRELAYYLTRLEQYDKSAKYFDEALKKTPSNARALLGRANVRSKICEYEGALKDIAKYLEIEPTEIRFLGQKALNTYLICKFEYGFIQNTRLVPVRKKPDIFVIGEMTCRDAIENCVGARTGRPLRDHFKIIRTLAWKKNYENQKPFHPQSKYKKKKKKDTKGQMTEPVAPKKPVKSKPSPNAVDAESLSTAFSSDLADAVPLEDDKCSDDLYNIPDTTVDIRDSIYSYNAELNVQPPKIDFPYKPLQNYTKNVVNYMGEKYLGPMNRDKIFLKNLRNQPGINCPNKKGSEKITTLGKHGYKTICYRQELLRTRRPFYFIKYQEAVSTGALKLRQLAELFRIQLANKREADRLVWKMKQAVRNKRLRNLLDLAEKLKQFCDSRSKKVFPKREHYLSIIYETTCQAYYDAKRLNKSQYEWDQEKRIYVMLGITLSREPSQDSVIPEFKESIVDWKKQASIYEDRLRNATTPEEVAWIYHELSICHMEVKQFELSRVYARKCIAEGQKLNNFRWMVNGTMLGIKVEVMQHNRNDAKDEAQKGIELAKMINNENLERFFTKCLQVIDKIEFDDVHGPKIIEKREKDILQLMTGTKMKDEAAHLFRKMSAMPATRRMSVMPGVPIPAKPGDDKISARKMSIMPTAKKSDSKVQLPTTSAKDRKMSTKSTASAKGVAFMEQIQYHID